MRNKLAAPNRRLKGCSKERELKNSETTKGRVMRIKLVLVLSVLCLFGCATQIIIDGAPAVTNMYSLENPETGIQVRYTCVHHKKFVEGNETMVMPEYLPEDIDVPIDGKTVSLSMSVRILNRDKHDYSVWEVYSLSFPGDTEPYYIEHKIYDGSLSTQEIGAKLPIDKARKGTYRLELRGEDNKSIFKIGNLRFEWRGGKEMP